MVMLVLIKTMTFNWFLWKSTYNYQIKVLYYLHSIRRDGSSKFGKNNKWGWFPTVSLGWNMQKKTFI